MWRIEYSDVSEAALLRFDRVVRERILRFFSERVAVHPEPKLLAEPLSGVLRGLWRFRVGDYRAICDLQGGKLVVLVLDIGHRSEVYK